MSSLVLVARKVSLKKQRVQYTTDVYRERVVQYKYIKKGRLTKQSRVEDLRLMNFMHDMELRDESLN